jgi:hypothetical protein
MCVLKRYKPPEPVLRFKRRPQVNQYELDQTYTMVSTTNSF